MLVLAIGDFHVPDRAVDIPDKFKKLLQPRGKIQHVLCMGNVTRSPDAVQFLKSISPDLVMVKGDGDRDQTLPRSLIMTFEKLRVGLIDGYAVVPKADPLSLLAQARMMDVDVLIYGSTHKVEAYTLDDRFFVSPGSATGAFSTDPIYKEDLQEIQAIVDAHEREKRAKKEDEKSDSTKEESEGEKTEGEGEGGKNEKSEGEEEKKTESGETGETEQTEKEEPEKPEEKSDEPTDKETTTEDTLQSPPPSKLNQLLQESSDDEDLDTTEIEDFLEPIPSFCLLDIQGTSCTLYVYTYTEGEVKVDKLTYRKGMAD